MFHGNILHPLNVDNVVDVSILVDGIGWNDDGFGVNREYGHSVSIYESCFDCHFEPRSGEKSSARRLRFLPYGHDVAVARNDKRLQRVYL
jgi:hypothetical protein